MVGECSTEDRKRNAYKTIINKIAAVGTNGMMVLKWVLNKRWKSGSGIL
jgi:hypothetical protein